MSKLPTFEHFLSVAKSQAKTVSGFSSHNSSYNFSIELGPLTHSPEVELLLGLHELGLDGEHVELELRAELELDVAAHGERRVEQQLHLALPLPQQVVVRVVVGGRAVRLLHLELQQKGQ